MSDFKTLDYFYSVNPEIMKSFFFLFFLSLSLQAQVEQVTFSVVVPNEKDSVFIVGNQATLGDWNPGAVKMDSLSPFERSISLPVNLPAEFKFTRGSWDSEGYTGKKWDMQNLVLDKPVKKSLHKILSWYDLERFNFSPEYISKNKGQYSIEVPEVQELVHIIFALTSVGKADSNLVNQEGDYYKEVLKHFGSFSEDPVVLEMQKLLERGMYSMLKMDACGFYFEGDSIKKEATYDKLSWYGPNRIEPFVPELERFARETNFRKFFEEHSIYYDYLKKLMAQQTPIRKQWKWLEKNFKSRYDNYRITFSPLVNGSHSTNNFVQPDFKQSVMFIRGPFEKPEYKAVTEGLMTVIIFTEIDHNYVNPVSDKYNRQISESLKDLSAWATEDAQKYYSDPYAVFNEYMTWAVYSLYAKQNFKQQDFEVINTDVENMMTLRRGFPKFREFNAKLAEVYARKSADHTIEDLYPEMLEWVRLQ